MLVCGEGINRCDGIETRSDNLTCLMETQINLNMTNFFGLKTQSRWDGILSPPR